MGKLILFAFIALVSLTSAFRLNHVFRSEQNLAAVQQPSQQALSYCPDPQYRSEAWMTQFLTGLTNSKSDSDQITLLQQQIPTDSHVFSTVQVVSTITKLTFDSSRLKAMEFLNPFIQSLTAKNVADILSQLTFSSNKMAALKLIANTLSDVSEASKKTITDLFTFTSDKNEALNILNSISARNCIYGTITEKVAAFVIDISGSMDQTFKVGSEAVSRLQFVKAQLNKTIAEQLKSYQKFNVIAFSNAATQWKPDYVDATTENIQAALAYINKLTTTGATNISAGLDLAFNSKQNLNGIYLLSDGVPNSGVMTVDGIKKYLNDKNASRTEKVHVNTISFILSGNESKNERNLSFQFLNAIADTTKGSFKGING